MSTQKKVENLQKKIDYLYSKQSDFQDYINKLQKELDNIKKEVKFSDYASNLSTEKEPETVLLVEQKPIKIIKKEKIVKQSISDKIKKEISFDWNVKDDFENFIGTNLINKIGILILIFGVIVGAKYAIDKELISPLTRIVIGYFISLSLLAVSMKLKKKYESFSAVLLSGSLATLYFLSFIAYSFYGFISQPIAFVLMLIFTVFTVLASISYNKQIIALIGLVGSYAIPFMLSNDSGNVLFLFSYISILNIGILILGFKKYWKLLYYSAFVFTWLIYSLWFTESYYSSEYFFLALIFATVFFLIFYITFLAYKLVRKEEFVKSDIVLILLNSFIYYSLGYIILSENEIAKDYLGLFTVLNAIVHFIVSRTIFKQKDADKKLFYLASILVLVFITMAIPVQLEGSWVTLFWALESALLFWVGRTKKIAIYENISYILMLLAFFSMFEDWNRYRPEALKPILNITFLVALIVSSSFGFITKILYDKKYFIENKQINITDKITELFKYIIPAMFIILLYFTFSSEIMNHFNIAYNNSYIEDYTYNYDILAFESLWLIFYTIIFAIILSFINLKYLKIIKLSSLSLIFNIIILFVALSAGLMYCSELRESYLSVSESSEYYNKGIEYIFIRYLNYAFIIALIYTIYRNIKTYFYTKKNIQIFYLGLHVVIVWILSSELLNLMDFNGFKNAYKIALTILWASYSLIAVTLGIWKKQKFLRIAAIGLFAITLVKLLAYDLAHLSTIHKTIVLITVGVLLLIVSFLYNKYSNIITEDTKENINEFENEIEDGKP